MSLKTAWNAIAGMLTGRTAPAVPDEQTLLTQQVAAGTLAEAVPPVEAVDELAQQDAASTLPEAAPPVEAVAQPPARARHTGAGTLEIVGDIEGNTIELGENITLRGTIRGKGNVIRIEGTRDPRALNLQLFGHENEVSIGAQSLLISPRVEIGSKRWPCSRARLRIGRNFSIASLGRIILPNSGNVIEIGDDCMFSSNIVIRAGEYPHLIFDRKTGQYLDVSDGIYLGNHVWVGEGAFIGKSVTLPDDCIVGTRSVVTKRFEETHCVIAGNPARIVKRDVQWVANEFLLELEFPQGHKPFAKTEIGRINRAIKKKQAAAKVAAAEPASSARADNG